MCFLDSGATLHITTSLENIQRPRPYLGKDCIFIVDGSPLTIHQSGQSVVTTSSNKSFLLQDLLHVPSTTHNLISVNCFCIDNVVCLLFDFQRVQVRDPTTEDVLLGGRVRGGLYELLLYLNHTDAALLCEDLSHYLWHCRLGNLNYKYMSILV